MTGASLLTLDPNAIGGKSIYLAVDIATRNTAGAINTGLVGATLAPGGVPEPVTWDLMILGFGGVGAALRSRRRLAIA